MWLYGGWESPAKAALLRTSSKEPRCRKTPVLLDGGLGPIEIDLAGKAGSIR